MISLGASSKNRLWDPLGDPGDTPWNPPLEPKGVRARPGTPRHPQATFLAPIGSPSGHFSHFRRHSAQNFGADLARGPTPSISLLFFTFFGIFFWKCRFWAGKKRPCEATPPRSNRAWKSQPPEGPKGPKGAQGALKGPKGPNPGICPILDRAAIELQKTMQT